MRTLYLLAALVLLCVVCIECHKSYISRLPNGARIPLEGQTCRATGHVTCKGKGSGKKVNTFGKDFKAAGKKWTKALCEKDSDGDGLTNGQEMGDPCCIWQRGDTPERTKQLSHPSHASSINDAPGCAKKSTSKTSKTGSKTDNTSKTSKSSKSKGNKAEVGEEVKVPAEPVKPIIKHVKTATDDMNLMGIPDSVWLVTIATLLVSLVVITIGAVFVIRRSLARGHARSRKHVIELDELGDGADSLITEEDRN